ncbi:MAG: hypothetical protein RSA41_05220 [Christensenella sp.]
MLTLWGRLYKNEKTVHTDTFTSNKTLTSDAILEGLEYFAKEFDIEVPMWHTNHTKQFGLFHKVTFKADDFVDKFPYDKFEMQIIDK